MISNKELRLAELQTALERLRKKHGDLKKHVVEVRYYADPYADTASGKTEHAVNVKVGIEAHLLEVALLNEISHLRIQIVHEFRKRADQIEKGEL